MTLITRLNSNTALRSKQNPSTQLRPLSTTPYIFNDSDRAGDIQPQPDSFNFQHPGTYQHPLKGVVTSDCRSASTLTYHQSATHQNLEFIPFGKVSWVIKHYHSGQSTQLLRLSVSFSESPPTRRAGFRLKGRIQQRVIQIELTVRLEKLGRKLG